MEIRSDWNMRELNELCEMPLLKLITQASKIHANFHEMGKIQVCHLISIKTGGCREDCKYCAQSSFYKTNIKAQPMMPYEEVIENAKLAIAKGATRICLGAAWRGPRDNNPFENVLKMVSGVANLGVEVCCTLGFLTKAQAKRLKESGLYAYNHNLDSSEEFYKTIITTRSYQDRLKTLDIVEDAGLKVCCGGIIGMGETNEDRLELVRTLSNRSSHPSSVPINLLSPVQGTPLANRSPVSFVELVRIIAICRITMPRSMVRLSAGRKDLSLESQALCFLAGANSIFAGEKLLTVPNSSSSSDENLFKALGLEAMH
ncbi:MAG: biotin synthase BioB [Simkaniaceae bacterium]|nr:biotin synthase BioB [Simkaniaceae bacterium]